MTVFACRISDPIDFGGCHVLGEYPAHAFAVEMYLQHNLSGCFQVFVEEFLDHKDDKLHRRVVVIEQDNLVHLRGLDLLGAALQHHRVTALTIFRPGRLDGRCCSRGWGFGKFRCHEIILASTRSDLRHVVIEDELHNEKHFKYSKKELI